MSRFLSRLVLFWVTAGQLAYGQLLVPPDPAETRSTAVSGPKPVDAATGPSAQQCDLSEPAKRCDTSIDWYVPKDAVKLARSQSKLLMVLHLSGNFEKEDFT